ncbi:MAG: AMP-binding protein [Clostridia bacterium]|nr:AMP-binding protein [Clostridia bacterium]
MKFEKANIKTPWEKYMGPVPMELDYFDGSMSEKVEDCAKNYPNITAYEFMGKKVKYKEFYAHIERAAKSLKALGVKEDEAVTICMPNCPQAIVMFYAANMIGAKANMVHPLSGEEEIAFCINETRSAICLGLDQFYEKFDNLIHDKKIHLRALIIASIRDELKAPLKVGYDLSEGKKYKKVKPSKEVTLWNDFLRNGKNFAGEYKVKRKYSDPAVILYSGGTTGTMKGIELSNFNFNALGQQVIATNPMFKPGDKMLAVMPVFHGFGLGVCIHSMLSNGGCSLLIPRFDVKSYAKLLKKHKPNFIAGVPTLYEALIRLDSMDGVDLSCLKGIFSGGDSLSIELKKKLDKFLAEHKASVRVREGYGATECVTACCLTPLTEEREGSIGIPFPDTFFTICKPGTCEELPYGTEGEICLAGPTVMMRYINNPEETENTLRVHADGMTYVHTGDLGLMDEDGFVYFKQRIKRMIVTSGYNVYPSQIENILDAHDIVHMSCVIGVHDDYKVEKVVAYVVLKPNVRLTEDMARDQLKEYLYKRVARYAVPKEIHFRDDLPKTLVGKVAYRKLQEEIEQEAKGE